MTISKLTTRTPRSLSGALRLNGSWRKSPNVKKRWTHYTRLADRPEPTMLRCTDRDQPIQDQVGYLIFAELWLGMRDAVRGNERDDIGVDGEASAFLGNVVGYD